MTSANDRQIGGSHYRGDGTRKQHWDLMIELNEGYFSSVITKYTERWRGKNGVEDVQKAIHYSEKWFESGQYELDVARRWSTGGIVTIDARRLLAGTSPVPEKAAEEKAGRLENILSYCREASLDEFQTRIFVAVLGKERTSKGFVTKALEDLLERAKLASPARIEDADIRAACITDLKIAGVSDRLVPRGTPEAPYRPGTPEDGGHHSVDCSLEEWLTLYRHAKRRGLL